MGADRGKSPFQTSDLVGLGPETRGLIGTLTKGFMLLAELLKRSIDTTINLEIVRAPETFVFLRAPKAVDITPGSAKEIVRNEGNVPLVVYIRAETYSPGLAAHLILDVDKERCTLARARLVKHSVAPDAKILLDQNQKLFADVTDSSGGVQTTFRITVTTIPLAGADIVFLGER